MTTEELRDLRQKASGKLATKLLTMGEADDAPKSKRRRVTSAAARSVKPTLLSRFVGVDAADVTKVSEMLSGREICVVNTPADVSKADVEKQVLAFGGSIAQNPGASGYLSATLRT